MEIWTCLWNLEFLEDDAAMGDYLFIFAGWRVESHQISWAEPLSLYLDFLKSKTLRVLFYLFSCPPAPSPPMWIGFHWASAKAPADQASGSVDLDILLQITSYQVQCGLVTQVNLLISTHFSEFLTLMTWTCSHRLNFSEFNNLSTSL